MRIANLKVVSGPVVVSALAVGLWLGTADRARAGPLNPLDFASLGAFPTAGGTYTINTSGTPTLTGPGGTNITGVVFNGVAVFDFDSIGVTGGQLINGTGSLPVALLSRNAITVSGEINVSAGLFFSPVGSPGPGGFPSNAGGGPGGTGGGGSGGSVFFSPGDGFATINLIGGSGGGGFGGAGGAGGSVSFPPTPVSPPLFAPGGGGGSGYGNLLLQLQGGGGGGGGGFSPTTGGGPGGGGGGAIELGAIGNISVSGSILANGLGFSSFFPGPAGVGGGSGGGIFLHGDGVTLTGLLSARGGVGSDGGGFNPGKANVEVGGGGGGGGGQVVIDPRPGVFADIGGTIDVSGGAGGALGGSSGTTGQFSVIAEPASLVLMSTGLLGLLGLEWRRRRTARA